MNAATSLLIPQSKETYSLIASWRSTASNVNSGPYGNDNSSKYERGGESSLQRVDTIKVLTWQSGTRSLPGKYFDCIHAL